MKKLIIIIAIAFSVISCKKEVSVQEYVGNITQIGTDAPIVTVLENTIGEITWSYWIKGYYLGKLPSTPSVDRIWLSINNQSLNGDTPPTIKTNAPGEILIESFYQGEHMDGILVNVPFEIRIYN